MAQQLTVVFPGKKALSKFSLTWIMLGVDYDFRPHFSTWNGFEFEKIFTLDEVWVWFLNLDLD